MTDARSSALPLGEAHVRRAGDGEIAKLESVGQFHSFEPISVSRYVEPDSPTDRVAWVAEANSRVAGISFGWESFDKIAHLCQVKVHFQYRDSRIDRELVRAALCSAREHGCLKVVLHNAASMMWAVEIVESLGFVFSRRHDWQGETCLEFYADLYARPAPNPPCQPGA